MPSLHIDTESLLCAKVLPELQPRADAQPVLQADALKYVTTFRSQLTNADIFQVLPHLGHLLGSESNVVHSYAAILLERLLASKVSTFSSEQSDSLHLNTQSQSSRPLT